jgi:hypothetical protein
MASLPFPQFLQRYGITLLFAGKPSIIPGTLIERRQRGYFDVGSLGQVLEGPSSDWETYLQSANFVYGNIERSLSMAGKASLDELGISINGGLGQVRSVTFNITGVKCRTFLKQSKILLIPRLQELRRTNRPLWKLVNNNWIADNTYYATDVSVEFDVDGNIDLQAEIQAKLSLAPNASIDWKSKSKFVIANNDAVPFGFSGWRV